jgi:hypothetical protein
MWTLWLTLDTTRFHKSGTWWTRRGTSGATEAGQPACEHGGDSPKWTSTCSFALEHAFTLNIKCWVYFLNLKILMFTLSFLGVSVTPNKSATNPKPHQITSVSLTLCSCFQLFQCPQEFQLRTSPADKLRPRPQRPQIPLFWPPNRLSRPGSFSGERRVPRAEFPRAMTMTDRLTTDRHMKFHEISLQCMD